MLGVLLLVVVGSIIAAIQKVIDSVGGITVICLGLGIIAAAVFLVRYGRKQRFAMLFAKYGDASIAQRIMQKQFWQGQTSSQLADSLGDPLAVDQKVLRNSTREIWKYNSLGGNRYGLRVTLENGVVVGWEQKG